MKVLHFHFGKDGGAEVFFVHLVRALAERGVEQKIVIRPGRQWKSKIPSSVEVIETHYRTLSIDRIAMPFRMRALVRKWQPDCLLAWMPRAAKLAALVPARFRLARLGDYPKSLQKFLEMDGLVCNTPGIAKCVADLGWKREIKVISNFTSVEKAEPISRQRLDTPDDAFVVSAIGRFVQVKGFDVLVKAAAEVPGAYFWLVGAGEKEAELRSLADGLGISDRVRFVGWQSDPRPFVAASDCFAMPSNHEPLGNVVLEAWAQQIPVVSTRSEGPSWFVQDGTNGLLVDIKDHQGLAAAISRVRNDPDLAASLVANGTQTLEKQFSKSSIVDAYMALFGSRGKPAGHGLERA